MAMFEPKQSGPYRVMSKVQTLKLPFTITANATAANVVITVQDNDVLFLNTQGVTQISTTTGALASGDTAPTYASATDSTGVFNVLVKIGESLNKVLGAKCIRSNGQEVISLTYPSAPSTGIVAGGSLDKIALNADSGVNFSTTNFAGYIEVDYVVQE